MHREYRTAKYAKTVFEFLLIFRLTILYSRNCADTQALVNLSADHYGGVASRGEVTAAAETAPTGVWR